MKADARENQANRQATQLADLLRAKGFYGTTVQNIFTISNIVFTIKGNTGLAL